MRILLIGLFLRSAIAADGIVNDINVSLTYGSIRTFLDNMNVYERYLFTDYFEVEVGREFNSGKNYLSLYFGFWDDGVSEPFEIMDATTYSNNCLTTGGRLGMISPLLPKYWDARVNLFIGYAYNFVQGTPVGGFGLDGLPGKEYSTNFYTREAGFNLTYDLFASFKILAGMQALQQMGSNNYRFERTRSALKIGLVYSL